ncbi:MAG: Mitochondrial import inner membrane translocase subunit tim22 [Chrysothrix sp. TS-e1954]|nr:MAG: Mitochondrial import inner membrane translocase subunit tim22 [Chrysothrix sp. TS-e1954]
MANLPGSVPLGAVMGGRGSNSNSQSLSQGFSEEQMVKFMQTAFESCPTKTIMAGGAGFVLGGAFGFFMSSMRYDTPYGSMGASATAPAVNTLPLRQQFVVGMKDMGKASYSSAKNFGMIGAMFSGTECCIEGLRAKNDLGNSMASGCITGGVLARNGGPQAVAVGCAGFAAFSLAIDSYMRMPGEASGGRID